MGGGGNGKTEDGGGEQFEGDGREGEGGRREEEKTGSKSCGQTADCCLYK